MYRVQQILLLIAFPAAAVVLSNCVTTDRYVWSYYDECVPQTSSFVAMAECGKQKELAACTHDNTVTVTWYGLHVIPRKCSPPSESLAFMQYTDALALAVRNNEMTEADAQRRFAEYKTQIISGWRNTRAIEDIAAAVNK